MKKKKKVWLLTYALVFVKRQQKRLSKILKVIIPPAKKRKTSAEKILTSKSTNAPHVVIAPPSTLAIK